MTLLLSCQKNGRHVFSRGPSPTETPSSFSFFCHVFCASFSSSSWIYPGKKPCILATDSSFERCTKIYCSAHKILFADCLEIGNEVKCLTVNFSFSSLLLFFFLASTCKSRKLKGDEEFKKEKKIIPLIFHNSGNFATSVTAVWSIQD